jgi:hypothetical protein
MVSASWGMAETQAILIGFCISVSIQRNILHGFQDFVKVFLHPIFTLDRHGA